MPIAHPGVYDAVYDAMLGMQAQIPIARMAPGTRVFRIGGVADVGRIGADKYRTVFNSSTNNDNRWTGPRPRHILSPKPAAAGVYTALGFNDALLGEFAFYAFSTTLDEDVSKMLAGQATTLAPATFGATLATKRIFEYSVAPSLQYADFSLNTRPGTGFLRSLDSASQVALALRAAGFHDARGAYVASGDHSLPRAMAQVVRDVLPGCRAIRVSSARAQAANEMRDTQGDNFVFFGPDGALITDLTPIKETWFRKSASGKFEGVSAPL